LNKKNSNIDFITPVEFSDKKQQGNETTEAWRIISLLMKESKKKMKA
jgi:hypothetical protein